MVVGLGNPGVRFVGTRHNLGFEAVEEYTSRHELAWKEVPKWKSMAATKGSVLLLKPLTFMNLSGESVRAAAHYYKILPGEILVILDDLALPPGRLRLRKSGSDGGHNGLASILQLLGTRDVPRLRVGIGSPEPPQSTASFVLEKPPGPEREILAKSLHTAANAIEEILHKGLDAAMNHVNTNQLS